MFALQDTGWSPFMYAIKDNKVSMADRMLELGCDVNHKNKVCLTLVLAYVTFKLAIQLPREDRIQGVYYKYLVNQITCP